jgi:hypothetical protein
MRNIVRCPARDLSRSSSSEKVGIGVKGWLSPLYKMQASPFPVCLTKLAGDTLQKERIAWQIKRKSHLQKTAMAGRSVSRTSYGKLPDKQEKATQTVLEQVEVIARDWAGKK